MDNCSRVKDYSYTFKFEDASKLLKGNLSYESPRFKVDILDNTDWKIVCRHFAQSNFLSIFIKNESFKMNHEPAHFELTLSVISVDPSSNVSKKVKVSAAKIKDLFGFEQFMRQEVILAKTDVYIPEDTLTIQCYIVRHKGCGDFTIGEIDRSESYIKRLNLDLHKLYLDGKFSDIKIETSDRTFPVHKTVLCARSPVFCAMFENDTKENASGVVKITDLDSDTVNLMLTFLYSDSIENLDQDQAISLYKTADRYDIPLLKKQCSSELKKCLSYVTVLETYILADLLRDGDLKFAAENCMFIYSYKFFKSLEWKEFMQSNYKLSGQVMHKLWTVLVKSLEFPAVTVCSRLLIPRINAHEARVDYMEDMKEYLNSIPSKRVPTRIRAKCHSNPLCTWNRFSERCDCYKDPCETTLCYTPKGSTACICSRRLCDWNPDGCRIIKDNGRDTCFCHLDFDYSPFIRNTTYLNREFNESFLTNVSQPVLKFIQLLKSGATNDLNDLDSKLQPDVRILDNFGISFDGLILSCNFAGEDCDVRRDFTTLYSPNYGKCYMFNYVGQQKGKEKPEQKFVKRTGRMYGLQLYLQTRRLNMLPLYARRLGARVTIHDPQSLPFSNENGFDLRHRDLHSLSIQSYEMHRLGPPFGECGSDNDNETSTFQEKPYNQINCERRCLNDHVFRRCKCYHRVFMSGTAIPTGIRSCRPEESDCFEDVLKYINENKVKCDCPAPCTEKKYRVSISVGKINKHFFRLVKQVQTLKIINGSLSVLNAEKKEDVMGVLVFYQSMSIINTTETSIYSWHFLISNIGGNLGLFLGLSIVTFVEVAEFLFDVAEKTFRRRRLST